MTVQSKLIDPLTVSCQEFLHPWTKSCVNATAGTMLGSIEPCLRMYCTVYVLALVMRRRIPTMKDIKNTIKNILLSSAVLSTNGCAFTLFTCILRKLLGRFYFVTIAFVPTFLASLLTMFLDRPARRAPLALYVANVGTESLWHMLEARGWVRSIPNGQILIAGVSTTTLLFLYRLGLHKTIVKDATFNIFNILLGKDEAGPVKVEQSQRKLKLKINKYAGILGIYSNIIGAKHETCRHRGNCAHYALLGGLKPFVGGVGLQLGMKLLMNISKIITMRMKWREQLFTKQNLKIGLCLGGFSFMYKSISCLLRHALDHDDPRIALPAGLIASIAFTQFPNNTIALYLFWKALQLYYSCGIAAGKLPEIPHFISYLYAFFTAVLFHSCILEANSVRPSYYKFLQMISSQRLSRFNVKPFDVFGLNSYQQNKDVYTKLKINMSSPFPKFPLVE